MQHWKSAYTNNTMGPIPTITWRMHILLSIAPELKNHQHKVISFYRCSNQVCFLPITWRMRILSLIAPNLKINNKEWISTSTQHWSLLRPKIRFPIPTNIYLENAYFAFKIWLGLLSSWEPSQGCNPPACTSCGVQFTLSHTGITGEILALPHSGARCLLGLHCTFDSSTLLMSMSLCPHRHHFCLSIIMCAEHESLPPFLYILHRNTLSFRSAWGSLLVAGFIPQHGADSRFFHFV